MSNSPDGSVDKGDERRRNLRLRGVFDSAFAMIEPFFDPAHGWGGKSLEHLAFRVVRENFNELSSEEVHTLVVAAHRVYTQRHSGSSDQSTGSVDSRRLSI